MPQNDILTTNQSTLKEEKMERQLQVEQTLLSFLNKLSTEGPVFAYGGFFKSSNTLQLTGKTPESLHAIGSIWPEWPGTYIICVGHDRGLFLKWKLVGDTVLLSLDKESFHEPNFIDIEQVDNSQSFRNLHKRLQEAVRQKATQH